MNHLTAAYIAMGAASVLRDLPEVDFDALIESNGGEMHVIRKACEYAETLDETIFKRFPDGYPGVFYYEIAEPFGAAFIVESVNGRDSRAELLATLDRIIANAVHNSNS